MDAVTLQWPWLLLAGIGAGIAGAGVLWLLQHLHRQPPAPAPEEPVSPRQEAQRYFLLNETGNVLIATSLSPSGRLPDATLALFSEALSHLSAVFFSIAGSRDPNTGEAFSLYDYAVLKKALELHPVFIRVSTEASAPPPPPVFKHGPMLMGVQPDLAASSAAATAAAPPPPEPKEWLEQRVKTSRDTLGMTDDQDNIARLRMVHAQMRAEAEKMGTRRSRPLQADTGSFKVMGASPLPDLDLTVDEMEIGHITLYCECLMGASLVSLKLAHAHCENYLQSGTSSMSQDTYLFVSPSQLRQTISELNNLPRKPLES